MSDDRSAVSFAAGMTARAFAAHGLGIAALIAAKFLAGWSGTGACRMRTFLLHSPTVVRGVSPIQVVWKVPSASAGILHGGKGEKGQEVRGTQMKEEMAIA